MRFLAAGLLAAALIVSCGDEPLTGPSPPAGPSPPVLGVTAVTIVGPASVPPGGSAQYTAMVTLSDGTEKAATTARWFSSAHPLLTIDENTGLARNPFPDLWGAVVLMVYPSLDGTGLNGQREFSREILVMPDGTFRMVGSVTDADSPGPGIPHAILEARLGEDPSSRLMAGTSTDGTGRYALYGVPADSYLHVRRVGYLPVTERIQIGSHTARDFQLRFDSNVPSFEGTYTMTVDATTCIRSTRPLDPQYRVRTYTATIRQSGARLTVSLSDARFLQGSDGFTGIATPTGADVLLRTFYDSYYFPNSYPPQPDVAELLDDGTFLETITTHRGARLTGTPDRVSGTVYSLRQWRAIERSNDLSNCSEPRITLTRR